MSLIQLFSGEATPEAKRAITENLDDGLKSIRERVEAASSGSRDLVQILLYEKKDHPDFLRDGKKGEDLRTANGINPELAGVYEEWLQENRSAVTDAIKNARKYKESET